MSWAASMVLDKALSMEWAETHLAGGNEPGSDPDSGAGGDDLPTLATPQNLRLENNQLVFDAVENANLYLVNVNGGGNNDSLFQWGYFAQLIIKTPREAC
jgi:hypothetical protein